MLFMGKSTISMAILNSYLYGLPEGTNLHFPMVFLWFSHLNLHFPMVGDDFPNINHDSSEDVMDN